MDASKVFKPAGIVVCALAVLSGCGKAGGQFSPPAGSAPAAAQDSRHGGARPANCTPTLWATTGAGVRGYTAANSPPCITRNSANGMSFQGAYTVAVGSSPNYVYVSDLLNSRIVVFDYNGNYVKWLSTTIGTTNYQPWGVCVSSQGVVGVGTIQQSAQGNVEFFQPTAPSGSQPTGDATGQFMRQTWCAFDSAGNFFVVDGQGGVGPKIDYLASSYVGMPGQTLVDSGLGSGSFWTGLYSRINSPADQTLSAATNSPDNALQKVYTWTVSGPPAGPLTFTPCACSPYKFRHNPRSNNPVDQVAPSVGGTSGVLYIVNLGKHRILQGPANGGIVTTYETLRGALGVATNPSGQY